MQDTPGALLHRGFFLPKIMDNYSKLRYNDRKAMKERDPHGEADGSFEQDHKAIEYSGL